MTDTEKLELEFYKNGSAESVLKRFVFSEQEEKLVRGAMRTAHLANPRMKLIQEADKLLREVAKTRKAVIPDNKSEVSPETLVKIELMKIQQTKKEEQKNQKPKNKVSFFGLSISKSMLFFIFMAVVAMGMQYYQNKEADRMMESMR
jgi:hypothetical protein